MNSPRRRLGYVRPFHFSVVVDFVELYCPMLLSIETLKRMARSIFGVVGQHHFVDDPSRRSRCNLTVLIHLFF